LRQLGIKRRWMADLLERREVKLLRSKEYTDFRAHVALQRIATTDGKDWSFYEVGPKEEAPLILVHGTCGTADWFFFQLLSLQARGYHVISVTCPPYWTHDDWVTGFNHFRLHLNLKKIHIFGAYLGGFLALHYVCRFPEAVESLMLCNSFCDTTWFANNAPCLSMFPYLPDFYLKKYVLDNFRQGPFPANVADAVDFAVVQLEALSRQDLASRFTLNCVRSRFRSVNAFDENRIIIIDSVDDDMEPTPMRQQLYETLPNAKRAFMRNAGDFPFLSCPDEVTLHIQVHLRNWNSFPGRPSPTQKVIFISSRGNFVMLYLVLFRTKAF